ncbi:uncharacterized protein LOC118188555 [Stegodyphus dumicola]|uniref:uncharacterized protein LOC118188555 n=1 Tax=Stegodyphus dumicola TaxID=202533 RepID=UPI0015AACE6A|nr:uncharacterized protein LOC118188555 [Stegodyphus dumicola]
MEKWATNSLKLKDVLQTHKESHKTETTVLGIGWNTNSDTLKNAFKTSLLCVSTDKPLTKRWLLRCIASFYDPSELFHRLLSLGKSYSKIHGFLESSCLLPANLSTLWYAAVKELDDISSLQIPRCIDISSHVPFAIHVFCDASERIYGSVLYIVTFKGDQTNVNLVCSRNKLAPIKNVTLPRLELLAALMGA